MDKRYQNTFHKSERLCSKRMIETLFSGGNKSFAVFPLRVVFMTLPTLQQISPASVLISVSKRHFKHAVTRNRTKRQIREAYRLNKHLLYEILEKKEIHIVIAFLWLADRLYTTEEVENSMKRLLVRITEILNADTSNPTEHGQSLS